jgi:hypothetical protein
VKNLAMNSSTLASMPGRPTSSGRLKIQPEIVFLDTFFIERFIPKTPIKEHKLVYVPREEKLRLCLVCFAIRVLYQSVVIWITPFKRTWKFDFSSEHQLVRSVVNPEVRALSCLTECFFDLDPLKW